MKMRSNSDSLVRKQHRSAQWAPLLGLMAAGLALTLGLLWLAHPSIKPVTNWQWLCFGWLGGLAVTVIGGLVLWQARRRTLLRSAAELDAVLETHNRLEAATALHSAQDAMAKAQRAETEEFLRKNQITVRRRWLPVMVILTTLLLLAHAATLICWARPVRVEAKAKANLPSVAEKAAVPATPTASIEWRSPESETAATAIEEVPLEAEADSSTGLRKAVLEVEVNGAHCLSQPITDDLTKAGAHTLKPSIYLDQLGVKTYDIVSYHLSAQRIGDATLAATVSPVQFVQVKPPREDTFICAGGDQPSKCFNYVTALKTAQLRLIKDNFTLAHADVSRDDADWLEQNSRVGNDQRQLADRTGDVIELMRTNHYPEEILGLVRNSQPLMSDAGAKIAKKENESAFQPQGQALGDLTEVEKYLQNSIKLVAKSLQPHAADPFQKPKNLELKTHPLTRAGKIDALAKAQSQLAGDLASGNTNSTLKLASDDQNNPANDVAGTPGERQQKIEDHISDFLNDPAFQEDALKHLQSSDDFASKSQGRIDQNDFAAASEPAAEAARELNLTAAALRAGGDQAAKNSLADALLKLAAAAGDVRRAPQAKTDAEAAAQLQQAEQAIQEAAKQLAAEAQRQRENGATNAADRLDQMAKMLQGQSLKQMLAQAQATPRDARQTEGLAQKLDDLANRAGQQRNAGQMSRQDLARLVERMQRAQTNLKNLASQCSNPGSSPSTGSSMSIAAGKPGEANKPSGKPGEATKSAQANSANLNGTASSDNGSGQVDLTHARAPELSRADMQRAEGEQLLDELRLDSVDARSTPSDLVYVNQLDKLLRAAAAQSQMQPQEYAKFYFQVDPSLTGVINSLQTQLAGMRRQFELADKDSAAAPPAYRAAVADYFEQISRDYHPDNGGSQ
jgi:hypothetical protein